MRIAILSAGPSTRQTFDPDAHFDLRIGVNAAVADFHTDWWACGDAQTFDRITPVGFPVLFTLRDLTATSTDGVPRLAQRERSTGERSRRRG